MVDTCGPDHMERLVSCADSSGRTGVVSDSRRSLQGPGLVMRGVSLTES